MEEEKLPMFLFEDLAHNCMRPSNKHHSLVHHYTAPQIVDGILEKERIKLRFTRADCMNDALEGSYADITFKNTCDFLFNAEEINEDYYMFLRHYDRLAKEFYNKDDFHPLWKARYEEVCLDYEYYLCCFSKNLDSLSLWNYYVKDHAYQGYSIGFDTGKMKIGRQGKKIVDVYFCSTEYSAFGQTCMDLILKYKDFYSTTDELGKAKLSILLNCFLEKNRLVVKHSCFFHEEEVRCVVKLKMDNSLIKDIDWSKGFPRPYIELEFEKSAFRDIVIGPLTTKDISKRITEEFLNSRGYPYLNRVKNSGVPIRF